MKRQSMEWYHQSSPHKKQFKVQASAHEVTVSTFWVHERMFRGILGGATINSERYVQTVKLKQWIWRVWPNGKWIKSSSCMTMPNSTPVCAQGRQLKNGVHCSPSSSLQSWFSIHWERHFADNELKCSREFYATGKQRLKLKWKKCVDNGEFVQK